jgi:hypothetical protein
MGQKERRACILYPLIQELHCLVRLHLQNISSKVKLLNFQDVDNKTLNPAGGPPEHGDLCDCSTPLLRKLPA